MARARAASIATSTASLLVPWMTPPGDLHLLPLLPLLVLPLLLASLLGGLQRNLSGRPQSLTSQSIMTCTSPGAVIHKKVQLGCVRLQHWRCNWFSQTHRALCMRGVLPGVHSQQTCSQADCCGKCNTQQLLLVLSACPLGLYSLNMTAHIHPCYCIGWGTPPPHHL